MDASIILKGIENANPKYDVVVIATQNESLPQPFGALGGMPAYCEYTCLKLPMARLVVEYSMSSQQNAHMLMFAAHGDKTAIAKDPVLAAARFVAAPPVKAKALLDAMPDFAARASALSAIAHDCPDWMPQSRGGRYGPEQYASLEALVSLQRQALAVEQTLLVSAGSTSSNSIASTVCAMASLHVETTKSTSWRAATVHEARDVIASFVMDEIDGAARAARAELKSCKPHTRWVLNAVIDDLASQKARAASNATARQAAYEACCLVEASATATPNPAPLPWQSSPDATLPIKVIHMATLAAHPAFKASGKAIMNRVCAAADALGAVLLLEALPSEGLALYYGRYNFKFVAWCGADGSRAATPLDKRRLASQNGIHMMRFPADHGAVAAAAANSEETPAAAAEDDGLADMARILNLSCATFQPFSVEPCTNKLKLMHRSTAVHNRWKPLLVWKNARCDGVLHHATWAAEYARQAISGELGPSPQFIRPAGDEEAENEAAAQEAARREMLLQANNNIPPAAPVQQQTVPPPPPPRRQRSNSMDADPDSRPPAAARARQVVTSVATQTSPARAAAGQDVTMSGPTRITFTGCTFGGNFSIHIR